jgi:hypothetical protein
MECLSGLLAGDGDYGLGFDESPGVEDIRNGVAEDEVSEDGALISFYSKSSLTRFAYCMKAVQRRNWHRRKSLTMKSTLIR